MVGDHGITKYFYLKTFYQAIYKVLKQAGISAAPYHAGLNPDVRSKTQVLERLIIVKVLGYCALSSDNL